MSRAQAMRIGTTLWLLVVMGSGAGCEEPAKEQATETGSPTSVTPEQGRLTSTGYVSDYFGFGLGFSEDWTAVSPADLKSAAAAVGADRLPLLYLRQRRNGNSATLVIRSFPVEDPEKTASEQLDEAITRPSAGCRLVKDLHDVMLGGHRAARFDQVCNEDSYFTFIMLIERDHQIQIRLTARDQSGISAGDAVLSTMTFY